MAKVEVIMPQMGESITTGTITKWHKAAGDKVKLDEILFEISTDKVESEIPSPMAGTIVEILYPEGATIDVGKVIAYVDDAADAKVVVATAGSKPSTEKIVEVAKVSSVVVKEETKKRTSDELRFYTPLVKKMASDAGVPISELEEIEGSGHGGRVNREDLENYLKNRSTAKPVVTAQKATPAAGSSVKFDPNRMEKIPLDNMRKAIARNMVESKKTSPHVNSIGEVDMSHLVKFREEFKDTFEKQEGFKLTYSPFIIRAIILALRDYPLVNASFVDDYILVKKDIHLGVAVAVPGNGLIVPVIKSADTLNMLGLCRKLNELALKARSKKLTMDDLTDGTYTFTNVGSFGTLMATPIILQPQLGIYASGVIKKRPIVINDDAIAIRSMMYGTHSYDHRLVDGELGGKFLESVHSHLVKMNPKEMF